MPLWVPTLGFKDKKCIMCSGGSQTLRFHRFLKFPQIKTWKATERQNRTTITLSFPITSHQLHQPQHKTPLNRELTPLCQIIHYARKTPIGFLLLLLISQRVGKTCLQNFSDLEASAGGTVGFDSFDCCSEHSKSTTNVEA